MNKLAVKSGTEKKIPLKKKGEIKRVKKVSIQGFEGSFHQEAARLFFGKDVEVICCATFREVIKIAGNKKESDKPRRG